jgi:pyruvate dehydrogenase E1 component
MYRFKASNVTNSQTKAHLMGSGAILNEVLKAQVILERDYGVSADVWSITSFKQLQIDAMDAERWNMLHPGETPHVPYIEGLLANEEGVFVAASDYVQLLPDSLAKWFPGPLTSLGTFGFGRSESRESLRDHFEVDARHIVLATLNTLLKEKKIGVEVVKQAITDLKINPEKLNPYHS